jgi:hypothetical protein
VVTELLLLCLHLLLRSLRRGLRVQRSLSNLHLEAIVESLHGWRSLCIWPSLSPVLGSMDNQWPGGRRITRGRQIVSLPRPRCGNWGFWPWFAPCALPVRLICDESPFGLSAFPLTSEKVFDLLRCVLVMSRD